MNKRKTIGKQIKAPKLPRHELEQGLPDASMRDRSYYAQLEIAQSDLSGQVAEHISFDQAIFQRTRLDKTFLKKVQVLDSRLSACDLANAEWKEMSLCRVELLGCHITGWQCSEAQLQDVLFKECGGSFAQFALSSFKSVCFENCDLEEANFMDVDLSKTSFINCNLRGADFTGTTLASVDLRSSQLDGARLGPRELKGAIINPSQALAFVRSLGISVTSLDELAETIS
ncbi:pentapeptide repeat-containing protein [Ktedonosporobacter rubrisoli]|uniref:Pentapeptide repeat-containing protein n=1 Tax=Ktedonosporobacter rubrisoli TaxID=2509675 RepID=A0A4P6JX28_KTERU|nr:pentapeptide repeat-containing protein [Ktedonosporobacter rubrisoli]QBD80289.1 pentapeptide repeat-containing protein [Ktedonosporobacter rubrisoli]